jgi:hypothetical protein
MMEYIDTHCHMVSRTTEDYEQMALTGCVAVTEPAFWAGYDRSSADVFDDYFNHITDFEPKRAAEYGIQHFSWLCLNPKEGEDVQLTDEVLEIIPRYLDRENVVGIGEIGFNRVTRNERDSYVKHIDLAMRHDQLILIHTPHLEDKFKGTKHTIEGLQSDSRVVPGRVLIDHAEEHTIGMILDQGYWVGLTLYPKTKTSLGRAADMIERFGSDRLCVNSACDWGPSTSLAVPRFVLEMRKRGHDESTIRKVVYDNPNTFLGQSPKFRLKATANGS